MSRKIKFTVNRVLETYDEVARQRMLLDYGELGWPPSAPTRPIPPNSWPDPDPSWLQVAEGLMEVETAIADQKFTVKLYRNMLQIRAWENDLNFDLLRG